MKYTYRCVYDLMFNYQAMEDDVVKRGAITTTTTDPARSVCTSHSEMSTVYCCTLLYLMIYDTLDTLYLYLNIV